MSNNLSIFYHSYSFLSSRLLGSPTVGSQVSLQHGSHEYKSLFLVTQRTIHDFFYLSEPWNDNSFIVNHLILLKKY